MSANNTKWLIIMAIAGLFGAFMGPWFASNLSGGTMMVLLLVILVGVVGFCVWALSSNKGAAKADEATQANAKALKAEPGKGRIYIVRRGFVAALQGMDVTLDDVQKSQIKSGQMLMADVAPGSHTVHVSTAKASLAKPATLTVNVAEGQILILSASLEMGAMKGTIELKETPVTAGQHDVQATKLMLWDNAAV